VTCSPFDDPELLRLFSAACDSSITAAESRELAARLSADESAQQAYLDFCCMHSELRLLGQAQHSVKAALDQIVTPPVAAPTSKPSLASIESNRCESGSLLNQLNPRENPLQFGLFVMAATLLLFAGLFAWVLPWWREDRPNVAEVELADVPIVAQITSLHQAEWEESAKQWERLARLQSGRQLMLKSGFVELTFVDGARTVLEGPCQFTVETTGGGTLKNGKLTADVPQQAIGFSVFTPTATVIDLGTRFGVSVAEDGASRVHVKTGKAAVTPLGSSRPEDRIVLTAGMGVWIDEQRRISELPQSDTDQFVWQTPERKPRGAATITFDEAALDSPDWVDQGWGADGYLFFGTHAARSAEGKTPGIQGVLKSGSFFTNPTAIDADERGTMTTHGNHPGGPTDDDASATVALQDPSGSGTFKPGGLYRRRIEADGIQGVFKIKFTKDIPRLRVAVLLDNQWVSSANSTPPKLQLTLSAGGSQLAKSPVAAPDAAAKAPRADWCIFKVAGIVAGDELTIGGQRITSDTRRYVHIGGLAFKIVEAEPGSSEESE
jgi:hypothetical protein